MKRWGSQLASGATRQQQQQQQQQQLNRERNELQGDARVVVVPTREGEKVFALTRTRTRTTTATTKCAGRGRKTRRKGHHHSRLASKMIFTLSHCLLVLIISSISHQTNGQQHRNHRAQQQLQALPLTLSTRESSSSSNNNNNNNNNQLQLQGEKPRLIPLVAAESGYSENSSVNILCTVSQGHHESLQFDWLKDGQLLSDGAELQAQAAPQIEKHSDHSLLRISRVQSQAHSGRYTCAAKNQFGQDSSSVNLIVNVKLQWIKEPAKEIVVSLNQELKVDCLAQGEPRPSMRWEKLDSLEAQGSSMQQLNPNANNNAKKHRQQTNTMLDQMHLLGGAQLASPFTSSGGGGAYHTMKLPPASASATRNQLAASSSSNGYKLSHHNQQLQQQQQRLGSSSSNDLGSSSSASGNLLVSSSRYLTIQRAQESDSGIYECIASNGHDSDLRKLVYVQVRGPPRILPIATADSYPEGSSINLICTVSGGQRRGLSLVWTINGDQIDGADKLRPYDNVAINMDDADISILKIKNATSSNSGQYTCTAKNPLGQDSTSVNIVINVEMKWTKTPKELVEVGLNQQVALECDAIGSPQPIVEWFKHSDSSYRSNPINDTQLAAKGNLLKIQKAQHKDSGLYECTARNGAGGDNLRKFVHLKVRDSAGMGPIKFEPAGGRLLMALLLVYASTSAPLAAGQQNGEVTLRGQDRQNHANVQGQRHPESPSNDGQAAKVAVQYLDANGQPVLVQFNYIGPPKILPIATADSYPEGATINLICTVSGGQRKGLTLAWDKDGRELNDESLRYSNEHDNLSIEKTGVDISILRITNATHDNSGRFTCRAKNPIGDDSTSVNIVINVELKWNKLPVDTEIGLNKDLNIECDATSQPQPQIQWTRLPSSMSRGLNDSNKSVIVSQGKILKITRAQHKDSGLYECIARNGVDQDLRRVIQVKVRGK